VDPCCRKIKIGVMLFEKMLREFDQRKAKFFLSGDPPNESALALYRKWGFADRTLVKGIYRENEGRLVLRREKNSAAGDRVGK
jgi:ribosomal protein S18 acetylase RimI-like enzyme